MAAPLRRRVTGLPECEDPVHLKTPEPRATALGATEWPYGDQRWGDGEMLHGDFAEAGTEGAVALKVMQREGGIGGHECYEDLDTATPSGGEKMPSDGFERGVRIYVRERN